MNNKLRDALFLHQQYVPGVGAVLPAGGMAGILQRIQNEPDEPDWEPDEVCELTWLLCEMIWLLGEMTWLLCELTWLLGEMTWLLCEMTWLLCEFTWLLCEMTSQDEEDKPVMDSSALEIEEEYARRGCVPKIRRRQLQYSARVAAQCVEMFIIIIRAIINMLNKHAYAVMHNKHDVLQTHCKLNVLQTV
jgi:hypothetical protein